MESTNEQLQSILNMIIEMEKTNKVNIDTIKWVIQNKIGLNRHELERREAKISHESSGLNKPVVNHPVCHLCRDTGWYFIPNFAGGGQTVRCGCGK